MDQTTTLSTYDRRRAVERLSEFIAQSVDAARAVEKPFFHLEFDRVFPDDIYAQILALMPEYARLPPDARPQQGPRSRRRHAYPRQDRPVSGIHPQSAGGEARAVGRGRPRALLGAGQAGLHPPAGARAGEALRRRLRQSRHVSDPDSDARHSRLPDPAAHRHQWKGITVQLYLPADDANTDIGTIFHERLPDGSMPKATQMRFAPNSGYAFAVGNDTWHSADPVHNRVKTRDSILLTYFVDQGLLKVLRNRGKRIGNFLLNEIRQRT